jgi:hypothetical protein
MEDHDAYGPGEDVAIDLSGFAGNTAQIEFRYAGDSWDWWYEVDNVVVTGEVGGMSPCQYLDFKPGSCPNSFNRGSNGVLPTAVVGMADFDVSMIDPATLVITRADGVGGAVAPIMGPPGPKVTIGDVATPYEGELCGCHEMEGDGIDDLKMKFPTEETVDGLELYDITDEYTVLVVRGNLYDGTPFIAADCVRFVPPNQGGPNNLFVNSNVDGAYVYASDYDLRLDSDGFALFKRTYAWGQTITLTAEPFMGDRSFRAWKVNGVVQTLGDTTLDVLLHDEPVWTEAIYNMPAQQLPGGGITPTENPLQRLGG